MFCLCRCWELWSLGSQTSICLGLVTPQCCHYIFILCLYVLLPAQEIPQHSMANSCYQGNNMEQMYTPTACNQPACNNAIWCGTVGGTIYGGGGISHIEAIGFRGCSRFVQCLSWWLVIFQKRFWYNGTEEWFSLKHWSVQAKESI